MNRSRVPSRIATACLFRPDQPLTHRCKLIPEALVRCPLSLDQEQTRFAQLCDYGAFLVKNVRTPFFSFDFSTVFTLLRATRLKSKWMGTRSSKHDGGKTTETGGSDPTFSAFSRPKSFVGSLPPVGSEKPSHTATPHHEHRDAHKSCSRARTPGPQEGGRSQCQS
jgi:hypothetical protein